MNETREQRLYVRLVETCLYKERRQFYLGQDQEQIPAAEMAEQINTDSEHLAQPHTGLLSL